MHKSVRETAAIVIGAVATILLVLPGNSAKEAQGKPSNGERLYMANCEACHMLGTNVIKPEKELASSETLVSKTAFKQFISKKHGVMPPFNQIADDEKSLKDLYQYCRKLKQQSWSYEMKEPQDKEVEMKEPKPADGSQ